ncbi:MAG TPA: exosortase/archaeosortase family protein [Acidimicrobiales bacterium]|nr:exosortase/archaeosortase family protein [Acidimicrobiales bacterium]
MTSGSVAAPTPFFRRPEVRFPVRFLCVGAALAVGWSVVQPSSRWLRGALAHIVVWLSNLGGLDAAAEPGAHVRFVDGDNLFRYVIDDGCTAMLVMATYTAAVVAYPTSRRNRVFGVAAGLPVLFVVNVLRLVTLGWVGLHARASFDAVHMYWWQVFFVAGTGLLWFAWVWWTSDARGVMLRRGAVALPGPTTTAIVVAGQLLAFAVLGLWAHGADLYYRVLRVPTGALTHVLWGGRLTVLGANEERAFVTYMTTYAQFAAVVALFLASPGIDFRTRLRGVLRWGVPTVMALQVVTQLWRTTTRVRSGGGTGGGLWLYSDGISFPLTLALHVGISLVVWHLWLQRARREEERRYERAAARSRRRRKGKTRRPR